MDTKKLDSFLALLAYGKRISLQLLDFKNVKNCFLIAKGFTPNKGLYYDFKNYGHQHYVSDYSRYLKHNLINYRYQHLFRDKYSNYIFLGQYTDHLVPVLGLINKGKCYFLNNYSEKSLFTSNKKFVLKPRTGFGGSGVHILQIADSDYVLNGKVVSDKATVFKGLEDYILVPYVYQHEYARAINPIALNTIRLLTCIIDEEVQIIGAVQRFGASSTGNVDNFTQGGISAKINVETGVIESAYLLNKKAYKKYQIHSHPDSNLPVVGLTIPYWETVRKDITALHQKINFVRYVGWDIAITADGYRIIESNHVSDVDVFQVHQPLLIDDVCKKFYSMAM